MIGFRLESLKESKPQEYLVRFLFGGLCTTGAGWIAKKYGPGIGGLFLAFPAIFPAGACLIETHEKRRKAEAGLDGAERGRQAAGVDAAGAVLGAIGLVAFALVVWRMLERHNPVAVIAFAALVWAFVSGALWWLMRRAAHAWGRRKKASPDAPGALLKH